MSDMTFLNSALALAEEGKAVFPLKPSTKVPATEHGQNDATTDRNTIIQWWTRMPNANIGIACDKSGLYVVDIDMGPGKVGWDSWSALLDENEYVPTYTVRTQSGGLHLYYKMTDDPLKNSASKLGKDIDTRGNGYVVAPGSVVDGRKYEIESDRAVAALPEWIAEALRPKPRVSKMEPKEPDAFDLPDPYAPHGPSTPPAELDEVQARVRELAVLLRDAPEGSGNDTASRVAFMAGQYAGADQIERDDVISTLLDAISGWSYAQSTDERTMQDTIIRQVDEGMKSPRAWAAARFLEADEEVGVDEDADEQIDPEPDASDWGTDLGQARHLRDRIGGMMYVTGIGWHVWSGKVWQPVDEGYIRNAVSRFYLKQFERMVAKFAETQKDKYVEIAKAYRRFMSTARLGNIIKALSTADGVFVHDANRLDAHPEYLNTPDGIVDLRTGKVWNHTPKAMMTKMTKGSYKPGYKHADWEMALEAVPADIREYVQLRFGQAATGFIPESDDALFLAGGGSNGKSALTTDGVFPALGDYSTLADPGLIMSKDKSGGATPERASIRGCRFVLIEELPEGRSLSIAEVKRITGTSKITARNLFQGLMTFDATHTLFITSNYLPVVNETDDGAWRRLCLVEFPYRFCGDPQFENERQGDPGLKSRVKVGAEGQHDAIVTWIVEGAIRYFADKSRIMDYNRPDAIRDATTGWRMQADRILAYFNERLVADVEGKVARADLYSDFCRYLEASGHAKWSQETFHSRFAKHQCARRANVKAGRTRDKNVLSRPLPPGTTFDSGLPVLPAQPPIYSGIRFQQG